MYVHENNIDNKINRNYGGHKNELQEFKNNTYLPMRNNIESLDLSNGKETFVKANDEMGLSKKIIANEYERLSSKLPSAMKETTEEMEAEGFIHAPMIARKVQDLWVK